VIYLLLLLLLYLLVIYLLLLLFLLVMYLLLLCLSVGDLPPPLSVCLSVVLLLRFLLVMYLLLLCLPVGCRDLSLRDGGPGKHHGSIRQSGSVDHSGADPD
jgi:hypothetical protein